MAEIQFARGIAIGPQATAGVVDPTIKGLTGTVNESQGAILGDSESGEGGSGIVFTTSRELREKATVSGSFTLQPSDFLSESVSTFTVAIPLKGNGHTASIPGTGAPFQPATGIDQLFEILGLDGSADDTTPGWAYAPGTQGLASAKIWKGSGSTSEAWVCQDVTASGLSIDLTPGGVAVATFTLAATVESYAQETFPTFDYGQQAVTSAPIVERANHNWGIGGALRGWTASTLTIDGETEDVPDSNAASGVRTRQTGFRVTNSFSVFKDSADVTFEHSELVRSSGLPDGPSEWTIGYPTGGSVVNGDLALGWGMAIPHPEVRELGGDQAGPSEVAVVEVTAVDTTANTEFSLLFK